MCTFSPNVLLPGCSKTCIVNPVNLTGPLLLVSLLKWGAYLKLSSPFFSGHEHSLAQDRVTVYSWTTPTQDWVKSMDTACPLSSGSLVFCQAMPASKHRGPFRIPLPFSPGVSLHSEHYLTFPHGQFANHNALHVSGLLGWQSSSLPHCLSLLLPTSILSAYQLGSCWVQQTVWSNTLIWFSKFYVEWCPH